MEGVYLVHKNYQDMKCQLIALSIIFSLLISGCSEPELSVKFENKTGHEIENLTVGDQIIGTLAAAKSTSYVDFESFGFDTGMPDEACYGVIKGARLESFNRFYWCGTQKAKVTEGKYILEIHLIETDSIDYLVLQNDFN